MAKRLTDIAIRNLKPGARRLEIPDPGQRGLYVQLQPSGTRGFAVRYRLHGRPCKLTLARGVTLAQARKLAADALYDVARGVDPAEHRKAQREKAERANASTLAAVAQTYMRREGAKLRTADQCEGILRRLILPALGAQPIASIRRSDIVQLLDKIEDTSGPRMADVT
ncbi:MAG TPA: Arm DNA-binding domain-containing protein, partial [Xanthobacteraceae bacterium]|nr:Arm DNA-binding domain-containing protein [Xanthobacteraceae bacterium]